jgi:hypothetical protein
MKISQALCSLLLAAAASASPVSYSSDHAPQDNASEQGIGHPVEDRRGFLSNEYAQLARNDETDTHGLPEVQPYVEDAYGTGFDAEQTVAVAPGQQVPWSNDGQPEAVAPGQQVPRFNIEQPDAEAPVQQEMDRTFQKQRINRMKENFAKGCQWCLPCYGYGFLGSAILTAATAADLPATLACLAITGVPIGGCCLIGTSCCFAGCRECVRFTRDVGFDLAADMLTDGEYSKLKPFHQ